MRHYYTYSADSLQLFAVILKKESVEIIKRIVKDPKKILICLKPVMYPKPQALTTSVKNTRKSRSYKNYMNIIPFLSNNNKELIAKQIDYNKQNTRNIRKFVKSKQNHKFS